MTMMTRKTGTCEEPDLMPSLGIRNGIRNPWRALGVRKTPSWHTLRTFMERPFASLVGHIMNLEVIFRCHYIPRIPFP